MAERNSIVALISDMGTRDPALAQLKTAALAVNPTIRFVDVTHEIKSRDLLEGAFTLERVFRDFPPRRTVFCVLVEGVLAAPRRPILAVSMDYYYFAPDNGVLSFVFEHDPISAVYEVSAEHLVKWPTGPLSVHRDVYGMALGWLTKGLDSSNFGAPIEDYARMSVPKAQRTSPQEVRGMILAVQKHGGLVSNIHENEINAVRHELGAAVPFRAVIGDTSIPVVGGFTEGGAETVAVYGPSGYVEIVSAKGDASKVLPAKRGDAVTVVFG